MAPMKGMKQGSGVMGHAGSVKHIEPCVFPDQGKVKMDTTSGRGYDSEAWNYKY